MARQSGIVITNDFSKGLFTEASGLNLPDNSASEIWDVEVSSAKKITRRPGWEYENNFTNHTIDRTGGVVGGFLWQNASGDGTVDVYVLQVGATLHFFRAADPFSFDKSAVTIDLTGFSPAGAAIPDTVECQYSEGNGLVFVTHPFLDTFYLTFNSLTSITATQIDPLIRDLEGLISRNNADSADLTINERQTSTFAALHDTHHYNLFNQGWHYNGNAAITAWDTARTDMPANSDIWWAFTDSSGDWAAAQVARIDLGNTPAPKGHYILNVYEEDRSGVSGVGSVSSIPIVSTSQQRASTSAFFSGRLWLAGINASGNNSKVYFTQVVQRDIQYNHFYQQNDPTIEFTPDLLPSDGGFVSIPDSGTIHKLLALRQVIMVFAQHGVWAITGSTGLGFTADDFSVVKISDTPTTTSKTFVVAEGLPMWWNDDGIHALTETSGGIGFAVVDVTDDTIKSFFEAVSLSSRKHAKGGYNPITKTVQWLYHSTEQATIDTLAAYDRVLTFNLRQGAWLPWTISAGDLKVHHPIVSTALNAAVVINNTVTDFGYSSTITTTFATDKVNWTAHGLADTEIVRFITSASDLPSGLLIDTDYYVLNKTANDFEVSLTSGGSKVAIADDGTGTHTAYLQDSPVVWSESTITTDFGTDNKIDWTAHGFSNAQTVKFLGDDLPDPIVAGTLYYVVDKTTDDFNIEASVGGGAITITDDGTGTHTAYKFDQGDTVISISVTGSEASPNFKYVISADDGAGSDDFTFGEVRDDTTWTDWTAKEGTGIEYSSYLITGYKIQGDTMRNQQAPYVTTFMDQEEGAGLILQGYWDWSANPTSGKFTSTQQCYNTRRTNFDLNVRRLKLRGSGKSLQLKFSSEAGKPFTILGWSQVGSVAGDV